MNTTALFVELIIIGVGAVIWLSILILSLFGYTWVPWKEITSIIALVPFLAITYTLGIAFDRLADQIFSKWDKKLRKGRFPNNEEYHTVRTYVYTHATDKVIDLFEYGRSRLRISRAWSVHNLILSIIIPIFTWTRFSGTLLTTRILITVFSVISLGLYALVALLAWRRLANNDYTRLVETYKFLKHERDNTEPDFK